MSSTRLPTHDETMFPTSINRRKRKSAIFRRVCFMAAVIGILALAALFFDVINSAFSWAAVEERELRGESVPEVVEVWPLWEGMLQRSELEATVAAEHPDAELRFYSWIDVGFLTEFPSRYPEISGFRSPVVGSLFVIALTLALSFPIGVGAAIYLEEYAGDGWLSRAIETNISNLAGVPSIIYGLLGLAIFVRAWSGLTGGGTVLAGALTMTLMSLPVIIVAAREAIRAVPQSLREGAYALGGSQWETTRDHVLPAAMPGILTGSILAMSRAIGETAPLITIGALTYIAFDPGGLRDIFTVMPIQIFSWVSLPQQTFHHLASAGILVLLSILLLMNALAIYIRRRTEQRW